MTFARAATLPKGVVRAVFRRAGVNSRNRSWRQVGRRGYASDHGHGHQQSSEIPWIIGSAAVTIPAAGYLLQQTPKKSDHGHDAHHEEHKEEATEEKEEEQPQEEESSDENKDETKDEDKEEDKDDSKDEKEEKQDSGDEESKDDSDDSSDAKSGDSGSQKSEDGYELPSPNAPKQINWDSSKSKGPGEGQKGQRAPTEKKGEKDAQGESSGAKHPYLDDPEKSKKGAGITDTAKIHGTVDPHAGARGAKETGSSSKD